MSYRDFDVFNTKNKQRVREDLWIPCFLDINSEINQWKKRKRDLRYLCFPGSNSLFVKHLLEKRIINPETFIIGVEKNNSLALKISTELGKLFKIGKTFIYNDKFERLICNNEEFCKKFPFDIAELDFTGSILTVNDTVGSSPYFEALDNLFLQQAVSFNRKKHRIKRFYLIITSNTNPTIPYELLISYRGRRFDYIKEEILKDYNQDLNHPYLNKLLKKNYFNRKELIKIFIISLNLRLINLGSRNFSISLIKSPYCYKGRKKGARMVSMVYICKKISTNIGTNRHYSRARINNLNESITQSKNTIFLPEPES